MPSNNKRMKILITVASRKLASALSAKAAFSGEYVLQLLTSTPANVRSGFSASSAVVLWDREDLLKGVINWDDIRAIALKKLPRIS